jgi:Flp pilus assembly pilin Flp
MKTCDFIKKEEGATAVDYAIMALAIAAVIVTVVASIGTKVFGLFTMVGSQTW